MTLAQKQQLFARLFGQLLVWIFSPACSQVCRNAIVTVRIDEVERSKAQADANAASGVGISNSLHLIHLAADLSLYFDGVYQTQSEAYKPLGTYWKSLNPLCCWGGDFTKPDGDHFSLTHNGVK